MNSRFSNLSQGFQLALMSVPVFVPATQNPDAETRQQIDGRQEKFLRLPKSIRWKLASFETGYKIELIGQKYQFELLRLANITRLVREYYFGEVRLENFPAEIERRMAVSPFTAQEIARYLKSEIIDWDPWGEYIARLPKLAARDIVQNHPKLADTEITGGYISLKGSEDLIDPTIKNWIRDYVAHLGYEKHSQMQRTQYLFHSENGRDLSSPDREKLGIILKSFDENTALPVDEENGEIVFDALIVPPSGTPTAAPKPQPVQPRPEPFIKPYTPASQPQRPIPPVQNIPRPRLPVAPVASRIPGPTGQTAYADASAGKPDNQLDKYFSQESQDIPGIKIQSITEHNEPKTVSVPRLNVPQKPESLQTRQPVQPVRPPHRIIDPFSGTMPEPKLDGNIVDLSGE